MQTRFCESIGAIAPTRSTPSRTGRRGGRAKATTSAFGPTLELAPELAPAWARAGRSRYMEPGVGKSDPPDGPGGDGGVQ
jgi:hypothetical protein